MSTSSSPRSVPLTGADCFLRAFDAEVRRVHGAGHLSQLVLRLGPGLDVHLFRTLIETVVAAQPILRAPIRRPGGLGAPVYRLDLAERSELPRIDVHEMEEPRWTGGRPDPDLPELFGERLNDTLRVRRGEILRFDLVRYAGGKLGTDLAMTWSHMLFDGAGSEAFVRFLDECHRGARRVDQTPPDDAADFGGEVSLPKSLRERGRMATAWQNHMRSLATRPPRSLAGPRAAGPQALRYDLVTFDAEETARATARAREQAGFLTPMLFYLAASIRAHDAVMRARSVDPGSYVVPLPVNLRPKGGEGAIFRTRVSMLWFQVHPEDARDMTRLLDSLKQQRRSAIRDHHVENGFAAMDFARFAPQRFYARMARRSLAGELASFFFAYTDDFLEGLTHFLEAPIENGFHAPSVPPSPGSSAIFSLRSGRLNLTHVYQRDVITEKELAIFHERLRADLIGDGG